MAENQPTMLDLKQSQIDYLDKMVEKYDLPDRDKAIRCLIAFAMQETDSEDLIFAEIRCVNC